MFLKSRFWNLKNNYGVEQSLWDGKVAYYNGERSQFIRYLANSPETINSDPYGAGWLAKIEVAAAPSDLLTAAQYAEITA
mgnify:CR=1 FL=1